jgi:hypothetical protein
MKAPDSLFSDEEGVRIQPPLTGIPCSALGVLPAEQVLGDEADATARKAAKAKQPWWLPPSQVSHYYRIAGVYFVVAVGALIASFAGAPAIGARMFTGLWLLMSIWHLLSAVAVRRRDRRTRRWRRRRWPALRR